MTPPNLLLVLSDQHRASAMGVAGNPDVKTPQLDRMASEGVRYTNAVSVAPICAPARASLQTGLYPHQHGVTHNGAHLRPSGPTLADDLRAAGYRTCYIGKCHWYGTGRPGFVPPEARLGWDEWMGFNRGHFYFDPPVFGPAGERIPVSEGSYEPAVQVGEALRFIGACDGPWAMQLNLGPPHTATMRDLYERRDVRERIARLNKDLGFRIPEAELFERPESWFPQSLVGELVPRRFLELYDPANLTLQPNVAPELEPLARYSLREYYAMVTALDEQIGRLLEALRGTDTIVVYTSDHGDQVGSHTTLPDGLQVGMPEQGTRVNKNRAKGRPLQNSYRVPHIYWAPERTPDGSVGSEDATPTTTLDLRPTLSRLAGGRRVDSLPGRSVVPGEALERDAVVFGLADWRARFDGRYCYVEAESDSTGRLTPLHLFDTATDPYDLDDLIASDAHEAIRARSQHRLHAHLREVGDPLGVPT